MTSENYDHEDDRRETISRALAVRSLWRDGMISQDDAFRMIERTLGDYESRRTEREKCAPSLPGRTARTAGGTR